MKPSLNPTTPIDLTTLIDTRLLIQANSGGGKSHCIRRILEQTHGQVQHLVLDMEGEFATLREKFDYVLAAPHGGDTVATPRSAALLAQRLLELGASAIMDVYELKAHERVSFVRLFLESLINAPKTLWHPTLVVVDEAHVFCPQKGEAESASAVIDLATRGRKRGFCAVLATQRLSKLHKDAAAECNNKLIGRTALDVDVDRAGDELGIGRGDRDALRRLHPGQFFVYGPAFAPNGMKQVSVGEVVTTHPKAGASRIFTPPPPTSKIKALLPKLADLPAEAESKAKTEAELRKELTETKRQLTLAQRDQKVVEVEKIVEVEVPVVGISLLEGLEEAYNHTVSASDFVGDVLKAARLQVGARKAPRPAPPGMVKRPPLLAPPPKVHHVTVVPRGNTLVVADTDADLDPQERRILTTAAMLVARGIKPERDTVARWMGIHPNGGRFNTNLGRMRKKGIFDERGPLVPRAGVPDSFETGLTAAKAALTEEGQRAIIDALVTASVPLARDDLAARLGLHPNGGRFNTNLGRLRTMGLISERGPIAITSEAYA